MPRYFLNLRDRGTLIEDPEGDEAQDIAEILRIAQATIDDIFGRPETYGDMRRWNRFSFEITDEAGELVLTVPFAGNGNGVG
ncbi:MAG: hypothetical protein K2Y56_21965 [Methylobacterium sp.]|uniref:DUF6894 family protein n=1 Tax=Methylobacterium sp. TaxID=409 RepID=UPI0025F4FB97|nr:hypothetical protein [Methylobacterium sp.]MBX9934152.1 hypothetical protein [Methylobacterium sp.]